VQKALPHLHDGASVVLVASNSAHRAFAGLTIYSAAKAGVISFARSFSQTLLPRRIRVNVLSPGTVDTPAFDKFGLSAAAVVEVKAGFANTIPLRRTGEPREMGRVAAFLASDDSSFLLGTEVLADGGSLNL
jgi:NAD(P)-dependent dehydrogenase (short-subunit alcohol dehydrogenase family)